MSTNLQDSLAGKQKMVSQNFRFRSFLTLQDIQTYNNDNDIGYHCLEFSLASQLCLDHPKGNAELS